jgi:23S rRNA pseudouridine2604 synthase
MTNDGDIVNKILRASNNHEKEYIVRVDTKIQRRFIEDMREGVPILDTVTRKCQVERIDNFHFSIVLTQGLNRQIRRMCSYFGYEVVNLQRVRIMNVKLGNLKVGQYRSFTKKELEEILLLVEDSTKTYEEK